MTQKPPARKQGRPTSHPVDQVRTRVRICWLKQVSGLRSAYAIEMALDGDRVRRRLTDVSRPRKWDGYEKGTTVPSTAPGPRNAIAQAEGRFPGAARYFFSPLWSYLKGDVVGCSPICTGDPDTGCRRRFASVRGHAPPVRECLCVQNRLTMLGHSSCAHWAVLMPWWQRCC